MKKMLDFFRTVKRKGQLLPLEEDLKYTIYDRFEQGLDRTNFPCIRLFLKNKKIGAVVVLNPLLVGDVLTLIRSYQSGIR